MPMTQQEMVKLLISIGGLKVKGGKGSHIKVKLPGVNRPIIVPYKLPKRDRTCDTEAGRVKIALFLFLERGGESCLFHIRHYSI